MPSRVSGSIPGLASHVSATVLARLALLTAGLTVGLVAYGAWVRISASGLGCPDWPLCDDGFFPSGRAATIESGHRWYAGGVMLLLATTSALSFLRRAEFPWPCRIIAASAAMIVVQAVLGAIVVFTELHPMVRLAHLGLAMAIIAMLTSGAAGFLATGGNLYRSLGAWHILFGAAGVILIGGSIVATHSSFLCPDLPFCETESAMAAFLHGAHRILAVLLFLAITGLALRQWMKRAKGWVVWLASASSILLAAQIAVGVVAVVSDLPGELRVLHVGLASLIWWSLVGTWAASTNGESRIG